MITFIIIMAVSLVLIGGTMKSKDKKMDCKDGVCSIEQVNSAPVKVEEASVQENSVIEVNSNNFEQVVINSTKPVIVDFYATWCPPCKAIKPVYAQLAQEQTDWVFTALDVDQAPDIMSNCGVKAMPTFVIFKNGIQLGSIEGGRPKDQLFDEIKKIIDLGIPQVPSKEALTQSLIMQICTKSIEGVKKAINDGADLNGTWQTPYGDFFPLKSAITSGTDEIVDLLLKSGAIINSDLEQNINLDIEKYNKSIEVLKQTLQYAKDKIKSLPNEIKQDVKLDGQELRQEFFIGMSDITKLKSLIDSGANANLLFVVDKIEVTPLYFAIMLNNIPAIDLLINAGASLQVEGKNAAGNRKSIELLAEEYMQQSNSEMLNAKKRLDRILNK
ncbi:MAG: thioredoxin domain-containing protein [Candidatus Babeliales bacterium]|nr:thioredoxin domain-containing protein [Candidatus Babeliales bacterium]